MIKMVQVMVISQRKDHWRMMSMAWDEEERKWKMENVHNPKRKMPTAAAVAAAQKHCQSSWHSPSVVHHEGARGRVHNTLWLKSGLGEQQILTRD